MGLTLKNKFTDKLELAKYFGISGVRIVEHEGVPIINPTNAILAKYLDGYKEDQEEREYVTEVELSYGYTDISSLGGAQRLKEEEMKNVPVDKMDVIGPEKVNMVKVSFLVETLDEPKIKKLITFRFFDAKNVTADGSKVQVFNDYGQVAYRDADGNTPDFFINTKEANVQEAPMSRGHLDFQDLVGFIYAYASLRPDKENPLIGELDLSEIMKGKMGSLEKLFILIHRDMVSEEGKPLYGAAVLFMVTNNAGTKSRSVQDYFHVFERYVTTTKGDTNKEFSYIMSEITRTNKPSKEGKVYSLASNGSFVGLNGIPKKGLKEFKPEFMDSLITMRVQKSQSDNARQGGGAPVFADFDSFD